MLPSDPPPPPPPQIEQLKEEITAKDRALVAEHFDHEGAKKLREQKEREVESLRKLLKQQDDVVAKQTSELSELNGTIRRMDANALQQRHEYDQVVTERDILGTQFIRRNDELVLLYEKVKIMESTLKKGEAQYLDRLQVRARALACELVCVSLCACALAIQACCMSARPWWWWWGGGGRGTERPGQTVHLMPLLSPAVPVRCPRPRPGHPHFEAENRGAAAGAYHPALQVRGDRGAAAGGVPPSEGAAARENQGAWVLFFCVGACRLGAWVRQPVLVELVSVPALGPCTPWGCAPSAALSRRHLARGRGRVCDASYVTLQAR